MTEQTPIRRRRRNILNTAGAEEREALREKVRNLFDLNKQMNASKNAYDKARAGLLKGMIGKELKELVTEHVDASGKEFTVRATIDTSISVVADPKKLFEKVGDTGAFLEVVSVSKGAIVEKFGTAMFDSVSSTQEGSTNVSVKAEKP